MKAYHGSIRTMYRLQAGERRRPRILPLDARPELPAIRPDEPGRPEPRIIDRSAGMPAALDPERKEGAEEAIELIASRAITTPASAA